MTDFTRKVGPKGQVVIPTEMRKLAGIRPESTVVFTWEGDKIILDKKKQDLGKKLRELVKKDGKHLGDVDWCKYYEDRFPQNKEAEK